MKGGFDYEEERWRRMTVIKETIIYKKITSRIYDNGKLFCRHKVEEEEVNAIEIPKNATYGDMIMKVLESAGNYKQEESNDVMYIYEAGRPKLMRVAVDGKLWDKPIKRCEEE